MIPTSLCGLTVELPLILRSRFCNFFDSYGKSANRHYDVLFLLAEWVESWSLEVVEEYVMGLGRYLVHTGHMEYLDSDIAAVNG